MPTIYHYAIAKERFAFGDALTLDNDGVRKQGNGDALHAWAKVNAEPGQTVELELLTCPQWMLTALRASND